MKKLSIFSRKLKNDSNLHSVTWFWVKSNPATKLPAKIHQSKTSHRKNENCHIEFGSKPDKAKRMVALANLVRNHNKQIISIGAITDCSLFNEHTQIWNILFSRIRCVQMNLLNCNTNHRHLGEMTICYSEWFNLSSKYVSQSAFDLCVIVE